MQLLWNLVSINLVTFPFGAFIICLELLNPLVWREKKSNLKVSLFGKGAMKDTRLMEGGSDYLERKKV